jgi:penicillin-binding protein A
MFYLFLLQFDWQKLRPENLIGGQVLERTPAGLSLVYLIGITILIVLLLLSLLRNLRPKFAFERDLPREVKRKLGVTIANRSLRVLQVLFVLLAFSVFGFHVYWAAYAGKDNDRFQDLSSKDLRYRRSTSSQLRGWMLDRSGKLGSALAYYKHEKEGKITRAYALDKEMAHLLGTELGSPGLERTLYIQKADPMPEAWEVLTKVKKPEEEQQRDVRITIDRDLQIFIAQQLEGKKGAIVVINPQNGDVVAIYSNPTFSLSQVKNIDDMHELERDKMNKPLLSRALREYYVPGSTFKTFTMISAFRAGKQNLQLEGKPAPVCYTPFPGSRPICDFDGTCEVCGFFGFHEAYRISSNQFFSQLAVHLGRERMRETAGTVGIGVVETPAEALTQGYYPDIWNTSNKRIAQAIAPQRSTFVMGDKITLYDLALQGMGQGYAGQMTPFQMALIAAVPGNLQGSLMKPKIEFDQPPQVFANVLSPQQASDIRNIMASVTEESQGTGQVVATKLAGTGIRVGGKTGTAEKQAPVYDASGKLKTVKKKRKVNGQWVQYDAPVMYKRVDSWFISIAPLENPQVAIAVVVEGGGQGARVAAPIAANVILKARELGLLGEQYRPKVQTPPSKPPAQKKKGR